MPKENKMERNYDENDPADKGRIPSRGLTPTLGKQAFTYSPDAIYQEWCRNRAYHPEETPGGRGMAWLTGAEIARILKELKSTDLKQKFLDMLYYDEKRYRETGEFILLQDRHLSDNERARFWERRDPLLGNRLTERDNEMVVFKVSVYIEPGVGAIDEQGPESGSQGQGVPVGDERLQEEERHTILPV